MVAVTQIMVEVVNVVDRELATNFGLRNLGGRQTSTSAPPTAPPTASTPTPTMSASGGSGGPTSSPLLFFVALGFGVVFTNLWIIVGVKYCFRYNARNRALRNGEEVDPIGLENMPARPHRRRREKKLMTMDEVNERFPLTKYKNWVASRAREGLPTTGGVTAPSSRAGSLHEVEGVIPSTPTESKLERLATANSDAGALRNSTGDRKSMEGTAIEKETVTGDTDEHHKLEVVHTSASTVDKQPVVASEMEDDEEDDHIHTAVPPELLTNPGDSCAICIDTLEDDDDIRGLTCGHAFHAGCLDPWLTSRRACCPLCKADYFTPKPRPEGEVPDTDRSARRREPRNMPQAPQSAWTGIRGPRLLLPARFGMNQMLPEGDIRQDHSRRVQRRARRQQESGATQALDAGAVENIEAAAPRRWRPSNPFSSFSLPGRNRQPASAEQNISEPSPAQLEAGVVR